MNTDQEEQQIAYSDYAPDLERVDGRFELTFNGRSISSHLSEALQNAGWYADMESNYKRPTFYCRLIEPLMWAAEKFPNLAEDKEADS